MTHQRERLEQQIAFVLELDKLKNVSRRSYVLGSPRRENSAEHSWHVALAAMLLAEHADPAVDRERVVKMLLVHDIVEIDAGDTSVYDVEARAAQAEKEARAAERIFGLLPDDLAVEIRAVWDEFEAQETPTAHFAKAIDRLLPLLHNARGGGRSWQDLGVVESQVREINAVIERGSKPLWAFVRDELDRAVADGLLPKTADVPSLQSSREV
jgi:putative hydrolase of HD superfamily